MHPICKTYFFIVCFCVDECLRLAEPTTKYQAQYWVLSLQVYVAMFTIQHDRLAFDNPEILTMGGG